MMCSKIIAFLAVYSVFVSAQAMSEQESQGNAAPDQPKDLPTFKSLFDTIQQTKSDPKFRDVDNPFLKILQPLFDSMNVLDEEKAANPYDAGENSDSNPAPANPFRKPPRQPERLDTEKLVEEILKYQNQTFKKWNKELIDFVPDDFLTFELDSTETFIEDIKHTTLVRGAFFTQHFGNEKIKFTVINPNNHTLLRRESNEEVFDLALDMVGEYRFIFVNKNSNPISVTFAIDIHNATNDFLQFKDLGPYDQRLEALHISMRDHYFYTKMSSQQYDQHIERLQSAEQKLFFYFLIEASAIIAISVWQVCYLKQILSDSRLI